MIKKIWGIVFFGFLFLIWGYAPSFSNPDAAQPLVAKAVVVKTSSVLDVMDLSSSLLVLSDPRTQVLIAIPTPSGTSLPFPLSAKKDGAEHRWAIIAIYNDQDIVQNLVFSVPHRSFLSLGSTQSKTPGSLIKNFQVSLAQSAYALPAPREDALAIRVPSGESVAIAMELRDNDPVKSYLWSRSAWENRTALYTIFHGGIFGVLGIFCLFFFSLLCLRRKLSLFFAFSFTLSGTFFLISLFGYDPVIEKISGLSRLFLRILTEGGLIFSFLGYTLSHTVARSQSLYIYKTGYFLAILSIILVIFGFFFPHSGLSLIEALFVFTIAGWGVLGGIYLYWKGIRRPFTLPLFVLSSIIVLLGGGALAFNVHQEPIAQLVVPSGFVVLSFLIFLLENSFFLKQTLGNGEDELLRHSLALRSADQIVWDWNPDQRLLFVGPELERVLGLKLGHLRGDHLTFWLESIHPTDRMGYFAALENAERRGRGVFSHDFRLRRRDGSYRWYQLRARVIPMDEEFGIRMIGTLCDITVSRRSEDRLLNDAVHDRVTGLPNRALFLDRLERALGEIDPRSSGRSVQVLVMDLDRFKTVNDGLGHEVGDSLLQITARRLSSLLSPQDTLARLSGDQFGLIFQNRLGHRHILEYAEQIKKTIAHPIRVQTQEIFLTASIGISGECFAGIRAQNFLKTAEIALYEAKRKGKNTIEFFRPDMSDNREYFVRIEHDLKRALERNELEVLYQPIVHVSSRTLAGFEALLRWRHSSGEMIGPSLFISIAEDSGMIHDLGRYVLNEAARQLGVWQRALCLETPIFVSVNLSCAQLLSTTLIEDLKGILAREDLSPGTLKLELTESVLIENSELSTRILSRIHQLGIGLACDDFGTGYSSLSNLRRIPFDTLKIDRSFLEIEEDDTQSLRLLENIIFLAKDLNLRVVVEGVEYEDQFTKIEELKADLAQGYYVGEPMTAKHVMETFGGLSKGKPARSEGGKFGHAFQKIFSPTDVSRETSNEQTPSDEKPERRKYTKHFTPPHSPNEESDPDEK